MFEKLPVKQNCNWPFLLQAHILYKTVCHLICNQNNKINVCKMQSLYEKADFTWLKDETSRYFCVKAQLYLKCIFALYHKHKELILITNSTAVVTFIVQTN